MAKKKINKNRKVVIWKGEKFLLEPFHNVYEINEKTGEVSEAKLVKTNVIGSFLTGKTTWKIVAKEGFAHIPAHDLYKAKVKFKQIYKGILKVKMD